jgi:hypothetical protein
VYQSTALLRLAAAQLGRSADLSRGLGERLAPAIPGRVLAVLQNYRDHLGLLRRRARFLCRY